MTHRCSIPGGAQVHMTTQNGRAFNDWLRTQLKAKKMSQRQLAQQSGVDHSTISRLIRGDRMPSLGHGHQACPRAPRAPRGCRYHAVPGPGRDRCQHQSDGSRRVRPSRRRAAERGAGPPDHGVLPRRPDAPVRSIVPANREPSFEQRAWRRRPLAGPLDARNRSATGGLRNGTATMHTIRPVARSTTGNRGATNQSTSRLGSALPARVWGTANAGVWGAGVRDSGMLRRACRKIEITRPGAPVEPVEQLGRP